MRYGGAYGFSCARTSSPSRPPSAVDLPVDRLVAIEARQRREVALERGDVERRVRGAAPAPAARRRHRTVRMPSVDERTSAEEARSGGAAGARAQPCLPVRVRHAVREQLVAPALGRLIAALDQLVGSPPVERAETLRRRRRSSCRHRASARASPSASSHPSSAPADRTTNNPPSSVGSDADVDRDHHARRPTLLTTSAGMLSSAPPSTSTRPSRSHRRKNPPAATSWRASPSRANRSRARLSRRRADRRRRRGTASAARRIARAHSRAR